MENMHEHAQREINGFAIRYFFTGFDYKNVELFYKKNFAEYENNCQKITDLPTTENDFINYELRKVQKMQKELYDFGTKALHFQKVAEIYIDFLKKRVAKDNTQPPQQLTIPPNILNWLQERGFIENRTIPYKWLKNKQLAREFLTHDKIKGSFRKAEMERQAPILFIYHKDNKPLNLAKNKKELNSDSDKMEDFLSTL